MDQPLRLILFFKKHHAMQHTEDKTRKTLPVEENKDNDEMTIKQNPNPRANANLTEDQKKDADNDQGVGSEITDGEGG